MRTVARSFAVSFAFALSAVVGIIAPAAQAGPVPGVAAEWPQFQGNPAHTGFNRTETTLNTGNVSGLRLQWIDGVFGTVDGSSPVVAGGSVYIASAGAGLTGGAGLYVFPEKGCHAATCAPSWRGTTAPNNESAPAVVGGLAYMTSQASFTSNNGRLNVFDAAGCGAGVCRPLWRGLGGAEPFGASSPAVSGGVVYVGSTDGSLYAFDAAGCGRKLCRPLWTGSVGDQIESSPAVAGGVVYAASFDGTLAAFDAAGCGSSACDPLWTADLDGRVNVASPAIAGGRLFIGNGNHLNVFDAGGCGASVCEPLWRGKATNTENTPAVAGGFVYIDAQPPLEQRRFNEVVEAFDVTGCGQALCKPLWIGINFNAGGETSPVVANGVVYVGKGPASPNSTDSGVFSYDAAGCGKKVCKALGFVQTGRQQLFFPTSPAVVNGRVYLVSTDTSPGHDDAGIYVFALPKNGGAVSP
jgi:outer membrane protein assembly factor BamB